MKKVEKLEESNGYAGLESSEEQARQCDHLEIERRCSNFLRFLQEEASTLKARSVNMRKFKSVLGSGYQETVSIEEIQQVLQDVKDSFKRQFLEDVESSRHSVDALDHGEVQCLVEEGPRIVRQDWERISSMLPGKTANQCLFKWLGLFKNPLQKNPWTEEENTLLKKLLSERTEVNWQQVSQALYLSIKHDPTFRTAKQCKEHYSYHLDPNIRKGHWTEQQDLKLLRLHLEEGKRWQKIASMMNGRTENSVKNRINIIMDKHVSPLMDPDTPVKDKIIMYLRQVEGKAEEPEKKQTPTAQSVEVKSVSSFQHPTVVKAQAIPQPSESDKASSTQARIQDQHFHTYATVDERRNVRYVTFMHMTVEQLLREQNILSAIFYKDTHTIMHKEIALVEKKAGGIDYDDNALENLIDFNCYGE